jgi:L-proline amide hydrolase
MPRVEEGYVRFRGHRTWYRSVGGEGRGDPLLTVHGGPGATHAVLQPLETLAESGRRVVFYDQHGCGRSDRPDGTVSWSISLFLDELATVRQELGLERLHVLGHSWGGMLAIEHLLAGADGVRSLVLASSPVSMRQWVQEARRLRRRLPEDVRRTLELHELGVREPNADYAGALREYRRRHVCRLDPWPSCVEAMLRHGDESAALAAMYGPDRFHVTGSLRGWDVVDRLPRLRLPVLITSGRYDEATPPIARTAYRRIPGARWELFGQSAHLPHLEEPEAYVAAVERFLDRVEEEGSAIHAE